MNILCIESPMLKGWKDLRGSDLIVQGEDGKVGDVSLLSFLFIQQEADKIKAIPLSNGAEVEEVT